MRWKNASFATAIMLAAAGPACAQTVVQYDFDIEQGSRAQVIQSIGARTGALVSFTNPQDEALQQDAGPIRGKLTLVQALGQALAGSGWFVEAAGNNQVRIARADGNSSDIIVTARQPNERKDDSNLLTRTDTPLKDTPGTIVSVTQEILRSQNVTSLEEATRNLPGASFVGGVPTQIGTRGGFTEGASFTNGLRNSSLGSNAPTIDVEAIELLKGPSSIISGTAVAGGLVNIVPKTATGTSQPEVSFGGGSKRYIRGSFDIGGAISEEARLFWRVVGLSEYADRRNEGGNGPHARSAALILGYRDNGWKIDAQTQIYNNRTVYGRPYFYDGDSRSIVATTFVDNSDASYETQSLSQNLRVEKDLMTSERFSLRARTNARYQEAEVDSQNVNFGAVLVLPPFGRQNYVLLNSVHSSSRQVSLSADIYAKLVTGGVQQQLIAAFDFSGEKLDALTGIGVALFPLQPIPPLVPVPTAAGPGIAAQRVTRNNYGVVIQDQITWGPLHALIGLRNSWFTNRSAPQPTYQQTVEKLTPSGGLVLNATPWASIYYSYQKGLTPPQPLLRLASGEPLQPIITTGHEAGIKLELLNARLSVTANYFHRAASYMTLPDPLRPNFSILAPGQKAEGFEITQVGKITPTLYVQSGFTYARPASAMPLIGTPRYTGNVWLLKNFKVSDSGVIDIGFGGNFQTDINVSQLNLLTGQSSFPQLPRDYARLDATLGYRWGAYRLNLAVNNLTDRFNLETPLVGANLFRATGRDVRLVFTANLAGKR